MKRLISLFLVMTVFLTLCTFASAAGKLQFDAQPSTQTIAAGKNCTFSVKCSNQKTITWHFVNPDTGEDVTGKNLTEHFKELNKTKPKAEQLSVSNPNSKMITLKNVPEEMHGWKVFCTIGTTKTDHIDSDTVYILIKGKPVPEGVEAEPSEEQSEDKEEPTEDEPAEDNEEPAEEDNEPTEDEPAEDNEEPAEEDNEPTEDESAENEEEPAEDEPSENEEEPAEDEPSEDEEEPAKKSISVKAVNALIYPISNEPLTEGGVTECTLPAPASFDVFSHEDPVCWLINGVIVMPPESLSHLTILNADKDITIEALTELPATPTDLDETTPSDIDNDYADEAEEEAEPADEQEEEKGDEGKSSDETPETDPSHMCTVTCENCRFTGGDYQYVTNGQVPSGTVITVVATDGDTAKGYSINGGEFGGKGKATVRIIVYEDSKISMQKRKGA